MEIGRLPATLLCCMLGASLALNIYLLWSIVDQAITLDYTSVALESADKNRDAAVVICNAALKKVPKGILIEGLKGQKMAVLEKLAEDSQRVDIYVESLLLRFENEQLLKIEQPDVDWERAGGGI